MSISGIQGSHPRITPPSALSQLASLRCLLGRQGSLIERQGVTMSNFHVSGLLACREYGDDPLGKDGTRVKLLVDEMDSGSREPGGCGKGATREEASRFSSGAGRRLFNPTLPCPEADLAPDATTAACTFSPYMPLPPNDGSSPGWMLSMARGYADTNMAGISWGGRRDASSPQG